jgi:O-methyltransferase
MANAAGSQPERVALDRLIRGFQISRMIGVVADLTLADRIAPEGSRLVADLSRECNVSATPLLRMLRALAAAGVFRITASNEVSHTPMSRFLRTDTPGSLHYGARFWTSRGSWRAWEEMDVALTNGTPHQAAWNMGRFEYLRQHPDEARVFDEFMTHFPDDRHQAVADGYDFSGAGLIADIGGNRGETLRRILARFPGPRGLVFDRDDVVAAFPDDGRMSGRIATEAGSFFDRVPKGADVYLLMRVLHDWSDDDCRRILTSCRAAMETGTRLLICEQILEPDPASGNAFLYSVDTQMLAMFGAAHERTLAEFEDLLIATRFAFRRLIPTTSSIFIIEAVAE